MLLGKSRAITGGAAIIGEEHGITLSSGNLSRLRIGGLPAIAVMCFRAAVDVQDQGRATALGPAHGFDQNAFDFLPVARGIGEGALLAEVDVLQPVVMGGPALEAVVLPDEELGRMLRAARFHRNSVSASLNARQDKLAPIVLRSDGTVGIIDPQSALCALVDHCRQPSVGQPFGVDRGFGRTGVERAILPGCHVDQVQRRLSRIVHIDPGNHRKLRPVRRNLDIAQFAWRFDHAQHLAACQVEDMRALRGIGIVDLRSGRAVDHGVAAIGRNAEGADIAGDRHGFRISIERFAHAGREQARQLRFLFIDDCIEASL